VSQRLPRRQPLAQERAKVLRLNNAPAEQLLWSLLRDRRLAGLKFRRQQPIGPYIADFYCHHVCFIVELDGETHELRIPQDAKRTSYLQEQGIKIYRVSNDDV